MNPALHRNIVLPVLCSLLIDLSVTIPAGCPRPLMELMGKFPSEAISAPLATALWIDPFSADNIRVLQQEATLRRQFPVQWLFQAESVEVSLDRLRKVFLTALSNISKEDLDIGLVRNSFLFYESDIIRGIRNLKLSLLSYAVRKDKESLYMLWRQFATADSNICHKVMSQLNEAAKDMGFPLVMEVRIINSGGWHIYGIAYGLAFDLTAGQFDAVWADRIIVEALPIYLERIDRILKNRRPGFTPEYLMQEYRQVRKAYA